MIEKYNNNWSRVFAESYTHVISIPLKTSVAGAIGYIKGKSTLIGMQIWNINTANGSFGVEDTM